jgi:NADPH:quinone reductase-like Zn-dependent oxidoreductase
VVGDHPVAGLDVGGVEHGVDVVEWHVEIAKAADDLRSDDLLGGVVPVSGFGVDVDRLEQADLVVVAKQLGTPVRRAGEVPDGQCRDHDHTLMSPLLESQAADYPLNFQLQEGRRWASAGHTPARTEEAPMTSQRTSGLPPVAAEGAIVVFGATGGVGRHAVEQLLGAGQEVIAVVRDPSKGTALAKAGARVVIHDLQHDDSGWLSRHLTGAESVLFAAGARYGAPLDELDAVDRGGTAGDD